VEGHHKGRDAPDNIFNRGVGNKNALRKRLEIVFPRIDQGAACAVHAAPTMGDLAERFVAEYLPKFAKSTWDTSGSMIKVRILPRPKDVMVDNLRPAAHSNRC